MRAGARTIAEEHEVIRARLEEVQRLADSIGEIGIEDLEGRADEIHGFLAHTVMPHAVAEGRVLIPVVRERTHEPTIGIRMTQCHVQVGRLVDELQQILSKGGVSSGDGQRDLRRVLYSIHALLTAHLDETEEQVEPLLEAELPEEDRMALFEAVERCAREVASLYE